MESINLLKNIQIKLKLIKKKLKKEIESNKKKFKIIFSEMKYLVLKKNENLRK